MLHQTNLDLLSVRQINQFNQKHSLDTEISRMLYQLVHYGVKLLEADSGILYVYDDEQATLTLLEEYGMQSSTRQSIEPLCQHVAITGEAVLLEERRVLYETLLAADITALLIVPVCRDGILMGALGFISSKPDHHFKSHEFELVQTLGCQAALILRTAESIQKAEGTDRIHNVVQGLLASTDIKHMMHIIARETVKCAGAEDVQIYLYDPEHDALISGISLWGPTGEIDRQLAPPRPDGLTITVARTGERMVIVDPANHPLFKDLPPHSHELFQFKTLLGLPLKQDGKVIGVLNALFRHDLTAEALEFLDQIEDHAAIAFHKGKQYQWVFDSNFRQSKLITIPKEAKTHVCLEDVLMGILKHYAALIPYQRGVILCYEHGKLSKALWDDMSPASPPLTSIMRSLTEEDAICKVVRSREPAILPHSDTLLPVAVPGIAAIRNWIVTPLIGTDAATVVLLMGHSDLDYTIEHLITVEGLADHAALAIENAILYQTLDHQSRNLEFLVNERTAQIVREREILKAIVDGAGEGIIFLRPDYTVEFVNQAWQDLTGYHSGQAVGKNMADLFHSFNSEVMNLEPVLRANGTWKGEFYAVRPDQSAYVMSATFTAVLDLHGEIFRLVGILSDITAQKELERMRRNFITNVSHELRTPVTTVKLYHTLLRRTNSADSMGDYLNIMSGELDRLERLIKDLLDISSLDQGMMPMIPQRFNLNEMVTSMIQLHRGRAEHHKLKITTKLSDKPIIITADKERIVQALTNLLVNGINHTNEGGEVGIEVSMRDKHRVSLTVWDSGTGISPKDIPFIFDRFYRSDTSKSYGIPGTGLGLSIVKEIVDLHNGEIKIESTLGHGTKFALILPLN
jgi:two-component system, OmpR family, phosphate regulon sensor histidine kinase PhoR